MENSRSDGPYIKKPKKPKDYNYDSSQQFTGIKKSEYTHSIVIPLNNTFIKTNVAKFHEECKKLNTDIAEHPQWLVDIDSLHIVQAYILAETRYVIKILYALHKFWNWVNFNL